MIHITQFGWFFYVPSITLASRFQETGLLPLLSPEVFVLLHVLPSKRPWETDLHLIVGWQWVEVGKTANTKPFTPKSMQANSTYIVCPSSEF